MLGKMLNQCQNEEALLVNNTFIQNNGYWKNECSKYVVSFGDIEIFKTFRDLYWDSDLNG